MSSQTPNTLEKPNTMSKKYTAEDIATAREKLALYAPKGATLYTVLRHCARSGMSRSIDVYAMHNNEPVCLTWAACRLLGWPFDAKNGGVKLSGCGMDMGFHLINSLSYAAHGYDCERAGYTFNHRWL